MIFLPRCAGSVAALTAAQTARLSMTAVRVCELAGGHWRIEATDGRVLGIIRGPSSPTPQDQRAAEALPEPESLALEVLLQAQEFAAAFKALPRAKPRSPDRSLG